MFKVIGATVVYGFAGYGLYKWWQEYVQQHPNLQYDFTAEQHPRPEA